VLPRVYWVRAASCSNFLASNAWVVVKDDLPQPKRNRRPTYKGFAVKKTL
jgi:hypothetical protein